MRRSSRNSGFIGKRTGSSILLALIHLAALTLLFAADLASAAPFANTFQFTQPDQTKITIWGEGDEFRAVFETTDGYTVVFDTRSKAYYYAKTSDDGKSLISTGVPAHHPAPPELTRHIRSDPATAAKEARSRREKWNEETGLSKRWSRLKARNLKPQPAPAGVQVQPSPPTTTTLGAKVGLTLLIDFPDEPAAISRSEVEAFLNGDSYTGFGNNGSVKQYFSDVSGSRLTYTNVVTAYIRMGHPKSYYNNVAIDAGIQGRLLVTDALAILKSRSDYIGTILPSFASLTTDEDNLVVAFNVYFAGGHSGVWNKGLWPHYFVLADPVALGNGKSIYNYQITNQEAALQLGTFCHENAHMLCGFPDIYDYDSDSTGGAGAFCLMNSGGRGLNPSQVSAYLMLAGGWATVTELDSASTLTGSLVAAPNSGHDNLYRYRRPGVSTEYFLLENRQKTARDANLPAAGIAVWHVDELGNQNNQSLTPNSAHQNYEVTLVQADNAWHFQKNVNHGDAFDLYYQGNAAPSYTGEFSDASSPNANWWDGSPSGLKLNSFSPSGMSMSFQVEAGGSLLPGPALTAEPPVTRGTENTIFWSSVSAAPRGVAATGGEPPAASLSDSAAEGGAAAVSRNPTPAHATVPRQSAPSANAVPPVTGPSPAPFDLFSEEFEGEFPGANWRVTGSPGWDDTSYDKNGGYWSAWCGASSLAPGNGYISDMDTWMIYGPFSLADATNASMSFWYKNLSEYGYDYFGWYASVDGIDFYGSEISGDENIWQQVRFDLGDVQTLGNLNGREQVWVGFNFYSDGTISGPTFKGAFVDDIVITKSSAPPPSVEYYVESADNPDFRSAANSGWIAQTQWTSSGLTLGKSYWYRVKARIGTQETAWSNVEHSLQEDPPTISGTPAASVTAGSAYSFVPTATRAASFQISNRPSWADFNTATGALTGTPTNTQVGSYPNIIITALNDAGTAALSPFTITVISSTRNTLSVTLTGSGGGTVTTAPAGIVCTNGNSSGCSADFPGGSTVGVVAAPDGNSTFAGWSGACQGPGACSVTMAGGRSVTASFSAAPNVLMGEVTYQSLQAACAAASAGSTIRARAIQYLEQLIIGHSNLQLKGGYDPAFSSNAGHTIIKGSMKIRKGPVTVERIVLR